MSEHSENLELRPKTLQRVFVGVFFSFLSIALVQEGPELWGTGSWVLRLAVIGASVLTIRGIGYALFQRVIYRDSVLSQRTPFGRTIRVHITELGGYGVDSYGNLHVKSVNGSKIRVNYHEGDIQGLRTLLQRACPEKELVLPPKTKK
jgi:hypothetical protein